MGARTHASCLLTRSQTRNPREDLRLPYVALLAQNTLATSRATAGILFLFNSHIRDPSATLYEYTNPQPQSQPRDLRGSVR